MDALAPRDDFGILALDRMVIAVVVWILCVNSVESLEQLDECQPSDRIDPFTGKAFIYTQASGGFTLKTGPISDDNDPLEFTVISKVDE